MRSADRSFPGPVPAQSRANIWALNHRVTSHTHRRVFRNCPARRGYMQRSAYYIHACNPLYCREQWPDFGQRPAPLGAARSGRPGQWAVPGTGDPPSAGEVRIPGIRRAEKNVISCVHAVNPTPNAAQPGGAGPAAVTGGIDTKKAVAGGQASASGRSRRTSALDADGRRPWTRLSPPKVRPRLYLNGAPEGVAANA